MVNVGFEETDVHCLSNRASRRGADKLCFRLSDKVNDWNFDNLVVDLDWRHSDTEFVRFTGNINIQYKD